jgi:hypothetical protein
MGDGEWSGRNLWSASSAANVFCALLHARSLIEKKRRKPGYSDFEDQIGTEATNVTADMLESARKSLRQFLSVEEEIERADLSEVFSSFFRRCDWPKYFVKGVER